MGVKNTVEKDGETGRKKGWEKRRKEQAEWKELGWEKGWVWQEKSENNIKKREERLRVKGKECRRNRKNRKKE